MSGSDDRSSRLVYTSEDGRVCPGCQKPQDKCVCKKTSVAKASAPKPGDGIVRIGREVNGRGGKTVSTISGLLLEEKPLQELASELKRRCGTGGTVKDGLIIIQGDHRDLLLAELQKKGYKAKKAGG